MSSRTSDFSELNKSTGKELYKRCTQSALKKRPCYGSKLLNITPLNLDQMKKEVEEAERSSNIPISTSEVWTLKQLPNGLENPVERVQTKIPDIAESKENIAPQKAKDDSFDLDFTALAITTPIKRLENSYTTPGITNKQFYGLATPSDKSAMPQRNQNNSAMKVPGSLLKFTPRISCTVGRNKSHKEHHLEDISENISTKESFKIIAVHNIEYLILNLLGRGGSSEVYQCYCLDTKSTVAIKCVSLQNPASANGYINEVEVLQRLQDCDRIITMYDFEILEAENKLFVVLEQGGEDFNTILKKLVTQQSHTPIYMLLFYWIEMLHAVKQIHSHGVIHSDLKPANFIRAHSGLKLIDFGIASSVQTDMTSAIKLNPEGSCDYISPEALKRDTSNPDTDEGKFKVHFKSDVWSLGCILYQLVYRKTPFSHKRTLWMKLACISDPNHTIEFPDVKWVPQKIINTIKECLQYDYKTRPSVDELIWEYETILKNI